MSKVEQLVGPGRLQHLQMIANHTANLRMMAEIGRVVELLDAFTTKIPAAQLGLRTCEVELGALVSGTDDDKIKAVLARRSDFLETLEAAARAAAKESGELAKKVKHATLSLKEQVVQLDNTLHHVAENLEALRGNTHEIASLAITALVAPLSSLRALALALKEEGRTAAGMTFDWRKIRNVGLLALSCAAISLASIAVIRPDLHPQYLFVPDGGLVAFVENLIAFVMLFFPTIIAGVMGCLAFPAMTFFEWKNTRDAAKMIESGRLPESQEEWAREADSTLALVAEVGSCLGEAAVTG